jgi:hypothetical protein
MGNLGEKYAGHRELSVLANVKNAIGLRASLLDT